MAVGETLYQRNLKRPLDQALRAEISQMIDRHAPTLPVAVKHEWDPNGIILKIRSVMMSFIVNFANNRVVVVVSEMSFAGRLFYTQANRQKAIQFFEEIATDLDL